MSIGGADIGRVRQHCAQCLSEVYADGRQAPSGETLCRPCYGALWGPQGSDELRSMVARHLGRSAGAPAAPSAGR